MAEQFGGTPEELEDRLVSVVVETGKQEDEGDLLDGLELVDPLDAGEIEDAALLTNLVELADDAENEIVLGPKFEEIKKELDKLVDENTSPAARRAVVVLLKEEHEDLTFDDNVDYGGVTDADLLEMTKLRSAVKVVEAGEAKRGDQWATYEDAAHFLQNEYNIQVLDDEEDWVEVEKDYSGETEAVVAADEMLYLSLFMRDFSPDLIFTSTGGKNAQNVELCRDLLIASGNKDYWDEYSYEERYRRSAHESMFEFAQTVYLEHVLGAAYLNDLEKTKDIILKEQEKIEKNIDGHGAEEFIEGLQRYRRGEHTKMKSFVIKVSLPKSKGGRGWGLNGEIVPIKYLENRFALLDSIEDEGEYSSDLDWISEILGENYNRDNYIKTNVYNREGWTPEENNLFDSILNLHDFSLVVNGSKSPDKEIREDLIRSIDGDIKNIINIQNKEGEFIVPVAMEAYDRVLREHAQRNPEKPVSIDDELVRKDVLLRLKNSGVNFSDSELKMLLSVGRGLCGMMGIDSQFYYSMDQSGEENKFQKLPDGSKGVLMNEAFNIVAIEIPYHTDPNKVPVSSYSNIDLGVVPFVNKLLGSNDPFSVPFGAENLLDKINQLSLNTEYQNWVVEVIGAKNAAKAEKKMLTHPQDPIGNLKLIMEEYGYKGGKKKEYILNRMKAVVYTFLSKRRADGYKDVKTTELISGLNTTYELFPSDKELNEYLQPGLPAKDDPDEVNEVIKTMNGVYGEKAKNDYMNSGKFLQFAKDNPQAVKKIVKRGGFLRDLIGEIKSSRR